LDLRHLRYFVAVAEELHFGRAAHRLHIAQPPLSQQIKQLETEMGVTLLQRTKRHVELTPAGATFLLEARRTLEQADQAVASARLAHVADANQLVLGFIDSAVYYYLPNLLSAYQRVHPNVELTLREMTSGQQLEALEAGSIQAGILRPSRVGPRIAFEEIAQERFVIAVNRNHRLARMPAIDLADLRGDPFVFFRRELAPALHDHMLGLIKKAGYSPKIVQEADQARTLIGLVAAGVGVFLTTESLWGWGGYDIVYKPLVPTSTSLPLSLAWRINDRSVALQAFVDSTREVIRSGALKAPGADPPKVAAGAKASPGRRRPDRPA
jgi:DNA-binding transcriptional LysR family regulator